MTEATTISPPASPDSLDRIVEQVRAFEHADHAGRDTILRQLVDAHPVMTFRWSHSGRFRRARKLAPGELPERVDQLVWPADRPAQLGRANPEGFAVLYIADKRDTALAEVGTLDHEVVVSEFCLLPGRDLRIAAVGELTYAKRTGLGFLHRQPNAGINRWLDTGDPGLIRSTLIVDAFLHECLVNRGDDYEVSSQVALAIFDRFPDLDAVAYPSRRQLGGICFALRTEMVWDRWGLFSVRRAHARHLAMGYYDLGRIRHVEHVDAQGQLTWSEQESANAESCVQINPLWRPGLDF